MDNSVLRQLTYGMYIVSSVENGKFNGQVVNTVFQTTNVPLLIAVCVNRENLTHRFIEASGRLTVSVLAEEATMPFIGRFGFRSGREIDKFKDTVFKVLPSGCPAVTEFALGYLEAEVRESRRNGRHTLFTCEVTGSETLSPGVPMTYGYYHRVKKGLTPNAAPTFSEPSGAR